MKDDLISIIVPVYNVERYLRKCVDSLLHQTYRNIEIILVDDGSPDSCGEICDEYASIDERVVVIHKENGGLSDARNAGLDIAKGSYIGFIDSDDYVDYDMFEFLHEKSVLYDADVTTCGVYDCYATNVVKPTQPDYIEVVDNVKAIYRVLEAKVTIISVVNKLYKSWIFDGLRFKKGKTIEDGFIMVDLLSRIEKMVITNEPKYYYYHRAGSITTSDYNERWFDAIEAYDTNYVKAVRISKDLKDVARMRQCWARFYVLDRLLLADVKSEKEREKDIVKFLRREKKVILLKDFFTKNRKISYLALLLNVKLYKKFVKQFYKRNRQVNA